MLLNQLNIGLWSKERVHCICHFGDHKFPLPQKTISYRMPSEIHHFSSAVEAIRSYHINRDLICKYFEISSFFLHLYFITFIAGEPFIFLDLSVHLTTRLLHAVNLSSEIRLKKQRFLIVFICQGMLQKLIFVLSNFISLIYHPT